jgi:phenylalanyl-tRNA synthetase beta chain
VGFNPEMFEISTFSDDLFEEGVAYIFNKAEILRFGLLRKKEVKRFDIKQDVVYADLDWQNLVRLMQGNKVTYTEVSRFPEVRRDLALVLDPVITYDDLEKAAYQAEKHILKSVSLFDIYQGDKIAPGKKSYALSFLLRDDEKTLTDQEIEKAMDRILRAFEDKFKATLR